MSDQIKADREFVKLWRRSLRKFSFDENYRLMRLALAEAQARITGLETIIESAPHVKGCVIEEWRLRMWAYGNDVLGQKHPGGKPQCTCFKSADPLKIGQAVERVIALLEQHDPGHKSRTPSWVVALPEDLREALDALRAAVKG